jgi:hypothetical protein
MKKALFLLFLFALLLPACRQDGPPPVMTGVSFATLGDSLTMGTQDAGLSKEMQLACYPYRIAIQMGLSGFQQPYVDPAIGIPPYTEPFSYDGGTITFPDEEVPDPSTIIGIFNTNLPNKGLSRPYDNLGVNGARLVNANGAGDLTEVTTYTDTASNNFFFDIVLRNFFISDFNNTTLLDQAAMLEPEYVILWIGNNDVLAYLISGGEDDTLITDTAVFEAELDRVIDRLRSTTNAEIVMANIPVNPDYLAYSHALDGAYANGAFRLFDPTDLTPIDFGGGETVSLFTAETPERLLLTAAAAYIQAGWGIPGTLSTDQESDLLNLYNIEVPDSPVPIPGDLTLTSEEVGKIETAVAAFNAIIAAAALDAGIPLLDAYTLFQPATFTDPAYDMATIDYVLTAETGKQTIFSLDGVHPSNLGHAIVTNEFITLMNGAFGFDPEIPTIDLSTVDPQYSGLDVRARSLEAVIGVRRLYSD